MFPNPQDAFPLPPHPDLDQYKKRAKELVRASRSGDAAAVKQWANNWLEALARAQGREITPQLRAGISRRGKRVSEFLQRHLAAKDRTFAQCTLSDAQFIIARSHGFPSWAKLVQHVDALAITNSSVADFEAAAEAIVNGDAAEVARLLREDPALIHARSTREHRATLLHYVAANGVENYRQKTPKNIVEITRVLLEAGAEVDATAEVYGGGATTLGLAATSVHPYAAGVQNQLMQILLDHGARMDIEGAGNGHNFVVACLANGRGEAAEYLAEHGAPLDLEGAAGVGNLAAVRGFFEADGTLKPSATNAQLESGFLYACGYGRNQVVEFLLDRGVDLTVASPGEKQTGLHWAGMFKQLETVRLLIRRGAPLEIENMYGGTPLDQTLWSAAHWGNADAYLPLIEAFLAAGAKIPPGIPPISSGIDELLTRYGSPPDPNGYWYGEGPAND
jgi:ankyrin repeat protein